MKDDFRDSVGANFPVLRNLIFLTVAALTATSLAIAIYYIGFVTPVEEQMGVVQKIFYFHVPSAYAMYVGFVVAAIGSAVYLITRSERWDSLGVAGAEVGVLFCLVVLTTGPLWARKAWGLWWTWDPRLTTTLLAGMIFVAYMALRSLGNAGDAEKRFAAGLAIVGLFILPIIHFSVQRWRGQHPTVISRGGGGLEDPRMGIALFLGFIAFTGLAALLIWTRFSLERIRKDARALEIELLRRREEP